MMPLMQLSELERKILVLTQLDSRLSIERLASLAGCRPHRARYALDRLVEREVIRPYTFINYFLLGILHFAAYLSLGSVPKKIRDSFLDFVLKSSRTAWTFELGGSYQYLVTVLAAAPEDMQRFMHSLPSDVKFASKSIAIRLGWHNFPCKYLCPGLRMENGIEVQGQSRRVTVDEADCRILRELSKPGLISQAKVARLLGAPLSTINRRVARMEEQGLIRAYAYWVDCSAFDASCYRLVLTEHGSDPTLEKRLLKFARAHPQVVGFVRCLGTWDFELRVEVFQAKQLNQLIQEIYDEFGELIESIESLPVLSRLKTIEYPAEIVSETLGLEQK